MKVLFNAPWTFGSEQFREGQEATLDKGVFETAKVLNVFGGELKDGQKPLITVLKDVKVQG